MAHTSRRFLSGCMRPRNNRDPYGNMTCQRPAGAGMTSATKAHGTQTVPWPPAWTTSELITAGWRRPLRLGVCDFPRGLLGSRLNSIRGREAHTFVFVYARPCDPGLTAQAVRQQHSYGLNHLHYLTANVYRRARIFDSDRSELKFTQALDDLRAELCSRIIGFVLVPGHCHLLIWPPELADPSQVMRKRAERATSAQPTRTVTPSTA